MRMRSALYQLPGIQALCLILAFGHSSATEITSDAQWTLSDSPVSLTEKVIIRPGVTLVVDAGVTVMLAEDAAILVEDRCSPMAQPTNPSFSLARLDRAAGRGLNFLEPGFGTLFQARVFSSSANSITFQTRSP